MDKNDLEVLDIEVPEGEQANLTACLFQEVPYGWEERPSRGGTSVFRVHVEDSRFAESLVQTLQARCPGVNVQRSQTPNRDWALAWREFFTAVPAGEDFIVIAPWMRDENPFPDRIAIIIEPKTAFGTGHHATTALCLEAISELFRAGKITAGMRFLDLGTGSGILGLGCAKLGLSGLGLDIDPLSIENSLENKEINGVGQEFAVHEGSMDRIGELAGQERFDLVIANILAEPLIDMAPAIRARVAESGMLILSGLLAIQVDKVKGAYLALGLPEPRAIIRDEWAALVWE